MKYCYHCGHMTAAEPVFCNRCGRSYDVKLCSRLHPNPRSAELCSQCGSRDLSTPQPRRPIRWKLFEVLVRAILLVFLVGCSILIAMEFLDAVRESAQVQAGLVAIGILLSSLWWAWSKLPQWFRKAVTDSMKRKRRSKHGD